MAELLAIKYNRLSTELIDHIKLFSGEGHWRDGKYMTIIPKDDYRYKMLKRKPRIRQLSSNFDKHLDRLRGCVWFKLPNGKFFMVNIIYKRQHIGASYHEAFYRETYYDSKAVIELIG